MRANAKAPKTRICRVCGKSKHFGKFPNHGPCCAACVAGHDRAWRLRQRKRLRDAIKKFHRADTGITKEDSFEPTVVALREARIPAYRQAVEDGLPLPYVDGHHTAESVIEDSEGIPQLQGAGNA